MKKNVTAIFSILFITTLSQAQGLSVQTLGGLSNFHNQFGDHNLMWQPHFSIGVNTHNVNNTFSLGFHYESKGTHMDYQSWKFNLHYFSISLGTGIKSKDAKTQINLGTYFSVLASLNLSTDSIINLRRGYPETKFKRIDYGLYADYSYFFYDTKKFSLGMSFKATYGLLNIFDNSPLIMSKNENSWTRNVTIGAGLVLSKKSLPKN